MSEDLRVSKRGVIKGGRRETRAYKWSLRSKRERGFKR